jgi:hypothetical protein
LGEAKKVRVDSKGLKQKENVRGLEVRILQGLEGATELYRSGEMIGQRCGSLFT